jgi:hypothetical protein
MAIDAFRVVFLHVGLVVEPYLRQAVPCFFQWYDVFYVLVFGFDPGMAFLAPYGAALFLVAVFAEIVENDHPGSADMAGVAFFLVFFLAGVMVAQIAFDRCVFMGLMALLVEDKGFSVHLFDVFINPRVLFLNMAFVAADRALVFISMAFNAEGVEHFGAVKTLVTVSALFYPLFVVEFMVAGYAGDVGFLMAAVGHRHVDGCFQGPASPGRVRIGVVFIHTRYGNQVGLAVVVRAGNHRRDNGGNGQD